MAPNKTIHSSWCFYAAIWAILAGIIISLVTRAALCTGAFWLLAAGILLFIALLRSTPLTMCFAIAAGLIFANLRVSPGLIDRDMLSQLAGQTITISGVISEDPDFGDSSPSIRINRLTLYPPGSERELSQPSNSTVTEDALSPENDQRSVFALSGTIYVKLARQLDLERSDTITLRGKLSEGFGTFAGTLFRPEVINIEKLAPGDIFAKFKNSFAELIRHFIPSPESDLGLGYLMGMKTGLSDSFSEALRAVGMTHVVVASGAHLSILTDAVRRVFGKISKFAGLMFSLLVIAGFVCVVGFTPSMTRASLVAIASLLTGYVGRCFTPMRLIGFVAALTLVIVPTNFFNLGWQLSFASFLGILVLAPNIQKRLYGGKKPPWLASMLLTSVSTSLICAPILIYNFGSVSLLSLVANLVILPTLPYVMLTVLLTGVFSILPWLAIVVAKISAFLLNLHIAVINFLSEQKAFIFQLPVADARIFLVYLPIIIFLCWPPLLAYLYRRKNKSQALIASPL